MLISNENHTATLRSGTPAIRRASFTTIGRTCLQNYKIPLTSAQDLAEICYKKLQIGNFSAADVRKWWGNLVVCSFIRIFAL